jgi:LysR family hca operon transcriptional activator
MNESNLRYFVAVAEELNFHRAAERLHTVQPSISAQIRKLEEEVGTPLFRRDKHHVELTEAGRVFLEESRGILRYIEHSVNLTLQTARTAAGHLAIGAILGAEQKVLSRLLPLLGRRNPGVQFSLRSLTSPELVAALQSREINVAFLRGPIEDQTLASELVAQDSILVALPSAHPLARRKRVPVQKLADIPFLQVPRKIAPALHDLAEKLSEQTGVQFRLALETDNAVATLNAVGSGLGFTLIPDYAHKMLPLNVTLKPLDVNPPPVLDLLVAYHKDDKLPALVDFLALLRSYMAEPTSAPRRSKNSERRKLSSE